jgi:hypothetical protein
MSKELEELIGFLHHGNTQIRQIACENLVGFSIAQPSIFKRHQLLPVRDLQLLVGDYRPIAKNALTILINLSTDVEVLEDLAGDNAFLETLLARVTNTEEPNADEIAMLLANMAKSDRLRRIINLTRDIPKSVSKSARAMDQLMDCFVQGAEGRLNKDANYDYLAYLFADLSKFQEGRAYFTMKQNYDCVLPLTKLIVFTEHKSDIRRRGVASTIKNTAFDIASHPMLLAEKEVNLLPYILLPIMGPEDYSEDEAAAMLPDLQLLPPDKKRDIDDIIMTHLEILLLLTTTRQGRDLMRQVQVYPVVRECHLHINSEDVREGCDRLVQMLMRDEEEEASTSTLLEAMARAVDEENEDEKIINIF